MSQHARNNPELYERSSDARAFSAEQEAIIEKTKEEVFHGADSGCPIEMCKHCFEADNR